jgi:hypothetical protein
MCGILGGKIRFRPCVRWDEDGEGYRTLAIFLHSILFSQRSALAAQENDSMRLKFLTFILILASSPAYVAAQSQDQGRDKYQPRTLSQIIKANSQRVAEMKVGKYSLFNADGLPSKVTVTYTGKSRKIDAKKKEFI